MGRAFLFQLDHTVFVGRQHEGADLRLHRNFAGTRLTARQVRLSATPTPSYPKPAALVGDENQRAITERLLRRVRGLQSDPAYCDYAGWLDYLASRIETHLHKEAQPSARACLLTDALKDKLERIGWNAHALPKDPGWHEWAYLSQYQKIPDGRT